MSLRLVPEILNPVDVILTVCKQLAMVDPVMPEVGDIQRVVATPGIGVHDAVWDDLVLHDTHQRVRLCVRNDLRINLATPLQYAKYRHFAGCTSAPFAFAFTAEVTLVDFNLSVKGRVVINGRTDQLSEPVKVVRGRRLVHTDQGCSRTCCGAGHEVLDQPLLLVTAQPASTHPAILEKVSYLGQPLNFNHDMLFFQQHKGGAL